MQWHSRAWKEIRMQRMNQVPDRCCVWRLGPESSHKKQGTVRRHSAGTNTVDQHRSSDVRGRGQVNAGKRGGLKARARRWVSAKEKTTSGDGLTDPPNRVPKERSTSLSPLTSLGWKLPRLRPASLASRQHTNPRLIATHRAANSSRRTSLPHRLRDLSLTS